MAGKYQDLRAKVAAEILAAMQKGVLPWRRGWDGAPCSGATGIPYRGTNAVWLDCVAMQHSFKSKYWNTFNNWKSRGIFPSKGTHGTVCVYFGRGVREIEGEDGKTEKRGYSLARSFVLFNAQQCNDKECPGALAKFLPTENPAPDYKAMEDLIARHGITVRHGGDDAHYAPGVDQVQMPHRGNFADDATYYATLAHEVCHWAEKRACPRSGKGPDEYADFELSAEIGSAYLLRELGLPAADDDGVKARTAAYLAGWLKRMKGDTGYFFAAAGRAGRLVDFLVGRGAAQEEAA